MSPTPSEDRLVAMMAQQVDITRQLTALATASAAASLPSSRARTGSAPQVRFDKVDAFDGKSGEALDAWISKMGIKHQLCVTKGGMPEDQFVLHAASVLSDGALAWWESLGVAAQPATWTALCDAMRKQFQPVDSADAALDSLAELKQGRTSVQAYASSFRTLMTRAGLKGDRAQVRAFMRGLREQRIKDELNVANPTTLDAAIERAVRMDATSATGAAASAASAAVSDEATTPRTKELLEELAALRQENRELRASPPSGQRYSSRRDRGANKTPRGALWTTVKGMTEELARARMEKRQCLHCGSDQHIMRDCKMREAGHPPRLN
jgi:hypothetical protein